jgi:glycosyltransferase involved in cell wall biosynthesis
MAGSGASAPERGFSIRQPCRRAPRRRGPSATSAASIERNEIGRTPGGSLERILFIRRSAAFGGIEVLLLDWLERIDYGKYSVAVASTMDCYSAKLRGAGLPVAYTTLTLPVMGSFPEIYRNWYRDIRKISPDKVVYLEGRVDEIPFPAVLAGYVATGGDVYMTEHLAWPEPPERTRSTHYGFIPGLGLWWFKLMWGVRLRSLLSRRVLAVSEGVRDTLLQYGYPENKIAIAYHGVDVERFSPSPETRREWRRRHGIPETAVVVASTARLAREKGMDRLIRAFNRLAGERSDLWLLMAGDGPLREELERSVDATAARERVRFLGLVDDVSEILQASDLFVLPSDREGLSVSLTEAMATGLICIATNVSGSKEVLREGESGFLVEPNDQGVLDGLAKALALGDPEKKRVSGMARSTILERFEKGKSIDNIFRLLDLEAT